MNKFDVAELRALMDALKDRQGARGDLVAHCTAVLGSEGVLAVLGVLNRRTPYRFTALDRFDTACAQNVQLFDDNWAGPPAAVTGPLHESFTATVIQTRSPLCVRHATPSMNLAGLQARTTVQAYCGVPVRDRCGAVIGTLCHFDVEPRDVPDGEMSVLHLVSARVAAWFSERPGHGWGEAIPTPREAYQLSAIVRT